MAAGFSWQAEALACVTAAPPPALVGVPAAGDTDVPTDVVLFYERTPFDLEPVGVLLTSSDGAQVAVTVNLHSLNLELTPQSQLLPNTLYTLGGTWKTFSGESSLELSFTTGAGPLTAPPSSPKPVLQHYRIEGDDLTSCSPPTAGTCFALPADSVVGSTYVDATGQPQGSFGEVLHLGSFFDYLSGVDRDAPFPCVQLRTRALNATYSEPVTLCGTGAPMVHLEGNQHVGCTPNGLTHDGPTADGCGCEVALGGPSRPPPVWVLTALAVFSTTRRLRKRRPRSGLPN